jgi:ATP-dependent DNA ligase
MFSRPRTLPAGFIQPCLPMKARSRPPARCGCSTSRSCIIDGEAVACDERGIRRIRYRNDGCEFLYAFDLIDLDLRRDPLVVRKATLASALAKAAFGIRFNEHLEFDNGEAVSPPTTR